MLTFFAGHFIENDSCMQLKAQKETVLSIKTTSEVNVQKPAIYIFIWSSFFLLCKEDVV